MQNLTRITKKISVGAIIGLLVIAYNWLFNRSSPIAGLVLAAIIAIGTWNVGYKDY